LTVNATTALVDIAFTFRTATLYLSVVYNKQDTTRFNTNQAARQFFFQENSQETQLSLTNRATHLCKCNGVVDLLT